MAAIQQPKSSTTNVQQKHHPIEQTSETKHPDTLNMRTLHGGTASPPFVWGMKVFDPRLYII